MGLTDDRFNSEKVEQEDLADKIIEILELDENNSITLYELDHDKEKQEKITKLAPDIRKYFTYTCIMGVKDPIKRPWLSIIKHVTKVKYKLTVKEIRVKDSKTLKTPKYYFEIN